MKPLVLGNLTWDKAKSCYTERQVAKVMGPHLFADSSSVSELLFAGCILYITALANSRKGH